MIVPLEAFGVDAAPAVWDAPEVDWASYDLVVLRSPWDYMLRREEFVAWAHGVGKKLLNPPEVVEWNTDKRYLAELAAAGVPVIPTTFVAPTELWQPPRGSVEYVIKPAGGAGSRDTGRYGPSSPDAEAAVAHMRRLQAAGRLAMVQPYLSAVDTDGETALLYFADPATGRLNFSHAIRKGPMLQGPDRRVEGLNVQEQIEARVPSSAELAVADTVISALPKGLLYARVDLIPATEGHPLVVEVELTEPSLFLGYDTAAADRFAASILARLA